MPTPEQWKLWRQKRAWYERNSSRDRRRRLDAHAAEGGFFVRRPHEGEMLDGLDEGRVSVGEGTLFEPGCWVTLGPEAEIRIGEGCFLNRNVMLAAVESIEIGDHTMFANGCFVGDGEHRYDDPEVPITWQGFKAARPGPDRLELLVRRQLRRDRRRHDRRPRGDRRELGRPRRHPRRHDRRRHPGQGHPRDRVQQGQPTNSALQGSDPGSDPYVLLM